MKTILALLLIASGVSAQTTAPKKAAVPPKVAPKKVYPKNPLPTHADVRYGEFERDGGQQQRDATPERPCRKREEFHRVRRG